MQTEGNLMGRPPEEAEVRELQDLKVLLEAHFDQEAGPHSVLVAARTGLSAVRLAEARLLAQARVIDAAEQALIDLHESLFLASERRPTANTLRSMAAFAKKAALAAGGETETLSARCTRPSSKWCLDRDCPIHGQGKTR